MDEGCTIVDVSPATDNPNYPDYPYISSPFHAVGQAELAKELCAMGFDVGSSGLKPENWVYEHYHEFVVKINPILQSALKGELDLSKQKEITEAWLSLALFQDRGLVPLEEVIGSADALNHGIPTPEEVPWAFTCLMKRGWLAVEGDLYGLTSEGRRAIATIVSQGNLERLNDWISSHPPSGRVTAMEVFLTLGRSKASKD